MTQRPLAKESDVFLCDHLWSFPAASPADVQAMLEAREALRARMQGLLELGDDDAQHMAQAMWSLVGSYAYDDREGHCQQVQYILDEVGSRVCEVFPRRSLKLGPEDDKSAGFHRALVFHPTSGEAFTAFWPRRDVEEGEIATCDNLPHRQAARLAQLQVLEGVEEEEEEGAEEAHVETAHRLGRFLADQGYKDAARINALLGLEATCGKLLPVWDISNPGLRPSFLQQLETTDSSALAFLISFFLMGVAVPRDTLLQHVPNTALLQGLEDLGLLLVEGHDDDPDQNETKVRSLVQITPVYFSPEQLCALVLTDFAQVGNKGEGFDPVMYIGPDSLGLVAAVPYHFDERPHRRILDLCAGSGVQGIVAALQAQHQTRPQGQAFEQLVLVELNPRAVRFARFNAALNHLEGTSTVIESDVREARGLLPCLSYDMVLSNPPYIPNPGKSARQLHQYGDGGGSGEEVMQAVVALAATVLTCKEGEEEAEGWLYIVGNLVNVDSLPARAKTWWGRAVPADLPTRFCVRACHGLKWTTAEYAALIHNHKLEEAGAALTKDPAVGRYKEALGTAGVQDVTNGFLFLKRGGKREEKGGEKDVLALHDQLWQVLAMHKEPEASETRRQLEEGWV